MAAGVGLLSMGLSFLLFLFMAGGLCVLVIRQLVVPLIQSFGLLSRLPLPRFIRFRFQNQRLLGKPCRTNRVLDRDGFSVGYDDDLKAARWASYVISAASIDVGNRAINSSDFSFHLDAKVPSSVQRAPGSYRKSGFDRGHLAPGESMDFSLRSIRQTYAMTNVVPQHPKLNRQAWRSLENDERKWARARGRLAVVCGPHYGKKPRTQKGLVVPSHFYKLIYSFKHNRCIAFLFPNQQVTAAQRWQYCLTVRELEGKTGLKFFRGPLWWLRRPDKNQKAIDWWRSG